MTAIRSGAIESTTSAPAAASTLERVDEEVPSTKVTMYEDVGPGVGVEVGLGSALGSSDGSMAGSADGEGSAVGSVCAVGSASGAAVASGVGVGSGVAVGSSAGVGSGAAVGSAAGVGSGAGVAVGSGAGSVAAGEESASPGSAAAIGIGANNDASRSRVCATTSTRIIRKRFVEVGLITGDPSLPGPPALGANVDPAALSRGQPHAGSGISAAVGKIKR